MPLKSSLSGIIFWLTAVVGTCACSGQLASDDGSGSGEGSGASSPDAQDENASAGNSEADNSASGTADVQTDNTSDAEQGAAQDDAVSQPEIPAVAAPDAPYQAQRTFAVRLTQAELDNTLSDILQEDSAPGTRLLAEDEYSPFDNDQSRQTVSQALIDSMSVLADEVAAQAVTPERRSDWMPCEPSSVSDAACFEQTTRYLSRLFFRRPLPEDEVANYGSLLSYAEESDDFYAAVELLLTAFIQDPEFLYRVERGTASGMDGILDLDGYEIASRMSFLLWGSGPSEELLDAAQSGALDSASGRDDALQSLLADERARRQLYRFHAMWLGYRTLPNSADLNAAFQQETQSLIERTVFAEPQSYLNLFSSTDTYLTTDLADHYGLPAPDGAEGWVAYPEDSQRAGILGHGSVLAAFSKFSDTSPTQRGIFVRTRLLCLDVAPPPPTVNVDQPPAEEAQCKLDRYKAHRERSGCAECHNLFDPIGFGLERFDIQGRYRETDDADPDCTIDASGELPGYGTFSGPKELSERLLSSDLVAGCFVRHYLQFALASGDLSPQELTYSADMATAFGEGDYHLDEWLSQLITSDAFARKVEEL